MSIHDQAVTTSRGLTRRSVLSSAATLATGGLLAACAPGGDRSSGADPSTDAGTGSDAAPSFIPFEGVTHDLPGTADGIPPGVYNYPSPPFDREGYPLEAGDPIQAFLQGVPYDIPDDKNPNITNIVRQLGSPLEIIYGGAGYLDKFQVMMASGDVPDMCMIMPVAELPKLLEKNFTDLTDVLGGDAVAKYPGLANIPTPAWNVPTVNGRLFGIPMPLPPAGLVITARSDTLNARGIPDPSSISLRDGQDFVDLLSQLTDKDKGEFAMGADPMTWLLSIVKQMVGTPNVWRLDGDTFVHENETEEMKTALDRAGQIVRDGYLHPNSFNDPPSNIVWWNAGVTALYVQSFTGWVRQSRFNVEWEYVNVEVPAWDGGDPAPVHKSTPAYGAFTGLKKTDGDRLDQMLAVADFLASPFGTQQFIDLNYGVEPESYQMQDGEPTEVEDGPPVPTNLRYCGSNYASVLYSGGNRPYVDAQHDYLSRVLPTGLDNAAEGLYSETDVTKAATMNKEMLDVQRSILQGRQPLSAWDDFVKRWKSRVGDQMAAEYADARAATT